MSKYYLVLGATRRDGQVVVDPSGSRGSCTVRTVHVVLFRDGRSLVLPRSEDAPETIESFAHLIALELCEGRLSAFGFHFGRDAPPSGKIGTVVSEALSCSEHIALLRTQIANFDEVTAALHDLLNELWEITSSGQTLELVPPRPDSEDPFTSRVPLLIDTMSTDAVPPGLLKLKKYADRLMVCAGYDKSHRITRQSRLNRVLQEKRHRA